jgi:hypothetical protein
MRLSSMKSNKYGGLNRRFWAELRRDLKDLGLPEPAHDHGFTHEQLVENTSKTEYKKLCEWLYGQTCMVDEKLGVIVYTHDVIRGLKLIRRGVPTYWD